MREEKHAFRREFETILRKLNDAERIVERINTPEKILTSRVSLKDCNYNLVSKFVVRRTTPATNIRSNVTLTRSFYELQRLLLGFLPRRSRLPVPSYYKINKIYLDLHWFIDYINREQ